MKNNIEDLSLEELLEEKSFISWILGEDNEQLENLVQSDSNFRSKVSKAREIVFLLRDDGDELDEESVRRIWKNINKFEQQLKQQKRLLVIRRRLSWAASILLVVSLGIYGALYFTSKNHTYQFTSAESFTGNKARMVLSTGEEIALRKDHSNIAVDNESNQVIVNDTVVALNERAVVSTREVQMNEVVIPFGKKSELLLADGTKVWLNAGSRLAFPSKFTGSTREVFLEGEACFLVAKNINMPFIVNADKMNVKVLGTYFNVSAYPTDETVETVLLEGSIAVEKSKTFSFGKSELILKPNQRASFIKIAKDFKVTDETDVDIFVAWTHGWLKYEKESLRSVLKKVERYYNVKVIIPENYLNDAVMSGKLDLKESIDIVMRILSEAAGFNFQIREDIIYIE